MRLTRARTREFHFVRRFFSALFYVCIHSFCLYSRVCVRMLHLFTVICVNICTKIIRLHAGDFVENKIDAAPLCIIQTFGFYKTEIEGILCDEER